MMVIQAQLAIGEWFEGARLSVTVFSGFPHVPRSERILSAWVKPDSFDPRSSWRRIVGEAGRNPLQAASREYPLGNAQLVRQTLCGSRRPSWITTSYVCLWNQDEHRYGKPW
jgi:hypothetical protein